MSQSYLIKNIINNTIVYNLKTQTILQACMGLGIEIPRYCFHNRLSIAGNCRMCLVEVYGVQKPVASCAQRVSNGNVIVTNSEMVRRIREGISQFLLYNHPLDCAVCDQGGECDLQDQVLVYGTDKSRFFDYKRTISDNECGPLIKTVMTRCIHCTRCVRFLDEVAGSSKLSVMGRGQSMEISSYLDEILDTEIAGNLIDLCPVGALTAKPNAFTSRSWELRSIESIDVFDSFGSNIRIDTGFSDIVRIVPISNDNLNEEWISDKIRFSFDGLSLSRIGTPMIRSKSCLFFTDWKNLLVNIMKMIGVNFFGSSLNIWLNSFNSNENDIESLFLSKKLRTLFGSSETFSDNLNLSNNFDFISNYSILKNYGFVSNFDRFVFIGVNLKLESPILNLKIRRRFLETGISNFSIGTYFKSNFPIKHLGNKLNCLTTIKNNNQFKFLLNNRTLFLINSNLSGNPLLNQFLEKELVDFVFISNESNYVGSSDIFSTDSIYNLENSYLFYKIDRFKYLITDLLISSSIFSINLLNNRNKKLSRFNNFLIGEEVYKTKKYNLNILNSTNDILQKEYLGKIFKESDTSIYQGIIGNSNILNTIDFVLPNLSFIEKKGHYKNIFNDLQSTSVVFTEPKFAKKDLDIYKVFISFVLYLRSNIRQYERFYSWNSFNIIKYDESKLYSSVNSILSNYNNCNFIDKNLFFISIYSNFFKDSLIYSSKYENFYSTNLISNSSRIMGNCSKNLDLRFNYFI